MLKHAYIVSNDAKNMLAMCEIRETCYQHAKSHEQPAKICMQCIK